MVVLRRRVAPFGVWAQSWRPRIRAWSRSHPSRSQPSSFSARSGSRQVCCRS